MILRNSAFEELQDHVLSENKKIIIFGAGMIGTVTAGSILEKLNISDQIECFIDNDQRKHNTKENLSGIEIYSPEYLSKLDPNKYILIIAISRYTSVLEQLEQFTNLRNIVCYILPIMCISNFKPSSHDLTAKESDFQLIPKVIHYMWLGRKKIPDTLQRCIDSWKKFCPDYEIIEWNEDNYDISKSKYMLQAYENKGYGFVPDYARLDILYNYGGIYLDTDVELIRSLDDMLYQTAFCCVEKWQTINFGGGSGSVKGNKAIGEMLKARSDIEFVTHDGTLNKTTCGYYDTLTLIKHGYKLNNQLQKIMDINVYPYEYFHPYDYMSGQTAITKHTYGIHHFNGGWLTEEQKAENKKAVSNYNLLY